MITSFIWVLITTRHSSSFQIMQQDTNCNASLRRPVSAQTTVRAIFVPGSVPLPIQPFVLCFQQAVYTLQNKGRAKTHAFTKQTTTYSLRNCTHQIKAIKSSVREYPFMLRQDGNLRTVLQNQVFTLTPRIFTNAMQD